MTQQWTMPAWLVLVSAAALVLLALLVGIALVASRRQVAEAARLRARLEGVEARLDASADAPAVTAESAQPRESREFVITRLGEAPAERSESTPVPVVPPGVFADIVLRESVVQSASLVHGLRRALAPEVRNRIRFEVRREVKRARKARRLEQREALREWQSRRRAEGAEESAA